MYPHLETDAEYNRRVGEIIDIQHALDTSLDPSGQKLLTRLDVLRCDEVAGEQERILAIVVQHLIQAEVVGVFKGIYDEVMVDTAAGDAEAFARAATESV